MINHLTCAALYQHQRDTEIINWMQDHLFATTKGWPQGQDRYEATLSSPALMLKTFSLLQKGIKLHKPKAFHSSLNLHTKMTNAFLLERAKPRKISNQEATGNRKAIFTQPNTESNRKSRAYLSWSQNTSILQPCRSASETVNSVCKVISNTESPKVRGFYYFNSWISDEMKRQRGSVYEVYYITAPSAR